jgi:hypothetical protein
MTDRVKALTVFLEQDKRIDDIEGLVDAIRHMRGVLDVSVEVSDINAALYERRAKNELRPHVLDLLEKLR